MKRMVPNREKAVEALLIEGEKLASTL